MARAPGVITRGTAKDLAEHDAGYAANGTSEHSRHSAHSAKVKMVGRVPKRKGKRSTAEIIAFNVSEMARLRGELLTENNPARLVKLKRDLEIKTNFVERLKKETRS